MNRYLILACCLGLAVLPASAATTASTTTTKSAAPTSTTSKVELYKSCRSQLMPVLCTNKQLTTGPISRLSCPTDFWNKVQTCVNNGGKAN